MNDIDKRLSEIKAYKIEREKEINEKYPEYCDALNSDFDALEEEIDKLKLAAYGEWEETPEYAAFQQKQARNLQNRFYA